MGARDFYLPLNFQLSLQGGWVTPDLNWIRLNFANETSKTTISKARIPPIPNNYTINNWMLENGCSRLEYRQNHLARSIDEKNEWRILHWTISAKGLSNSDLVMTISAINEECMATYPSRFWFTAEVVDVKDNKLKRLTEIDRYMTVENFHLKLLGFKRFARK